MEAPRGAVARNLSVSPFFVFNGMAGLTFTMMNRFDLFGELSYL